MDAFSGHSGALVRAPDGTPAPGLFDWWCNTLLTVDMEGQWEEKEWPSESREEVMTQESALISDLMARF